MATDTSSSIQVGFVTQPFENYLDIASTNVESKLEAATQNVKNCSKINTTVRLKKCFVENMSGTWFATFKDTEKILNVLYTGHTLYKLEITKQMVVNIICKEFQFEMFDSISVDQQLCLLYAMVVFKQRYYEWNFAVPVHENTCPDLNKILKICITSSTTSNTQIQVSSPVQHAVFFACCTGMKCIINAVESLFGSDAKQCFKRARIKTTPVRDVMVTAAKKQAKSNAFSGYNMDTVVTQVYKFAQYILIRDARLSVASVIQTCIYCHHQHGNAVPMECDSPHKICQPVEFRMNLPDPNQLSDYDYAVLIFNDIFEVILKHYGATLVDSDRWLVRLVPDETKHLYTVWYFDNARRSSNKEIMDTDTLIRFVVTRGHITKWHLVKAAVRSALREILQNIIRVEGQDLTRISWHDLTTVFLVPFQQGSLYMNETVKFVDKTATSFTYREQTIEPRSIEFDFFQPDIRIDNVIRQIRDDCPADIFHHVFISNLLVGYIVRYAKNRKAFAEKFGEFETHFVRDHWYYLTDDAKYMIKEAILVWISQFVCPNKTRSFLVIGYGPSDTGKSKWGSVISAICNPTLVKQVIVDNDQFSFGSQLMVGENRVTAAETTDLMVLDETTSPITPKLRTKFLNLCCGNEASSNVKYKGSSTINSRTSFSIDPENSSTPKGGGIVIFTNSPHNVVPQTDQNSEDAMWRRIAPMYFSKRPKGDHVGLSGGVFQTSAAAARAQSLSLYYKFIKSHKFPDLKHRNTWVSHATSNLQDVVHKPHTQFEEFAFNCLAPNLNKKFHCDLTYLVNMFLNTTSCGMKHKKILEKMAKLTQSGIDSQVNAFRKKIVNASSKNLGWQNVKSVSVCDKCSKFGDAYPTTNGSCVKPNCKGSVSERFVVFGWVIWCPTNTFGFEQPSLAVQVENYDDTPPIIPLNNPPPQETTTPTTSAVTNEEFSEEDFDALVFGSDPESDCNSDANDEDYTTHTQTSQRLAPTSGPLSKRRKLSPSLSPEPEPGPEPEPEPEPNKSSTNPDWDDINPDVNDVLNEMGL